MENRYEERSKRQELIRRLNETEELTGTHGHEPGEEGSQDAYDLKMELQRQRTWRANVGASAV